MNDTLMTIMLMSLTGSVLAIALFLLKPVIRNRVSKAFLYYIWLPVLLRLIAPFGFAINVAYETPPAPTIAPVSFESVEPASNIPIPENAVPVLPGDTGGPFTVTVTAPGTQTPSIAEVPPGTVTETGAAPKTEEKTEEKSISFNSFWIASATFGSRARLSVSAGTSYLMPSFIVGSPALLPVRAWRIWKCSIPCVGREMCALSPAPKQKPRCTWAHFAQ